MGVNGAVFIMFPLPPAPIVMSWVRSPIFVHGKSLFYRAELKAAVLLLQSEQIELKKGDDLVMRLVSVLCPPHPKHIPDSVNVIAEGQILRSRKKINPDVGTPGCETCGFMTYRKPT